MYATRVHTLLLFVVKVSPVVSILNTYMYFIIAILAKGSRTSRVRIWNYYFVILICVRTSDGFSVVDIYLASRRAWSSTHGGDYTSSG